MAINNLATFFTHPVVVPILTFVGGFLVSRFTLSARDRRDEQQRRFENAEKLTKGQQEAFEGFAEALRVYNTAKDPDFDEFHVVTVAGERYFSYQHFVAQSILGGSVDPRARDQTLVPKIADTITRTLPHYYMVLNNIARKKNYPYNGILKRKDYESLYEVVEKFAPEKLLEHEAEQ